MAREIINAYYEILSKDFPAFLHPYLELPLLRRLEGVGLLCGTDWTSLYNNRFFYSRLDHSIGVALIIWNFTKTGNKLSPDCYTMCRRPLSAM